MKRKKTTRAAAVVMTVMLTAFTLIMSGCGTGSTSETEDTAGGSTAASSEAWEYVSPSDLKGDTVRTDSAGEYSTEVQMADDANLDTRVLDRSTFDVWDEWRQKEQKCHCLAGAQPALSQHSTRLHQCSV